MTAAPLSDRQRASLKALVRNGESWAGSTHPTLSALERRGLADWEIVAGRGFVRWFPTDAGRAAMERKP